MVAETVGATEAAAGGVVDAGVVGGVVAVVRHERLFKILVACLERCDKRDTLQEDGVGEVARGSG